MGKLKPWIYPSMYLSRFSTQGSSGYSPFANLLLLEASFTLLFCLSSGNHSQEAFSPLGTGTEFKASAMLGSNTEMKWKATSIVTPLPWDMSDGKIYKLVNNSLPGRDIIRFHSIIFDHLQTFMGYWKACNCWPQTVNRGTVFPHSVCACPYTDDSTALSDSCHLWWHESSGPAQYSSSRNKNSNNKTNHPLGK